MSSLINVLDLGVKTGQNHKGLEICKDWFQTAQKYLDGTTPTPNSIRGARGLFFAPGYAYPLGPDETLRLHHKQTLAGLGPKSLLYRATHSPKTMVQIDDVMTASVRDLVLDAGKTDSSNCILVAGKSKSISIENVTCRNAKVGINLEGGQDLRLTGCELHDNTNNIQLGALPSLAIPSFLQDVLISNCIIRAAVKTNPNANSTEANGIFILNHCKNLVIDGNIIKENQNNGIALYASGSQIVLSNNEVRRNGNHGVDILADYQKFDPKMGWQNEGLSLVANRISENDGDGVRIHGLSPEDFNPYEFLSSTKKEFQHLSEFSEFARLANPKEQLSTTLAYQSRQLPTKAKPGRTIAQRETTLPTKQPKGHYPFLKKEERAGIGMRESASIDGLKASFLLPNTDSSTFFGSTFAGVPFGGFQIKKPDFAAVQKPPDVEFDNVKIWLPITEPETPWYQSFLPATPFNILLTGNQIAENKQHGVFNQAPFVALVGNLITDNASSKKQDYHGVCFLGVENDENAGQKLPNGLITNNTFVNNGRDIAESQSAGLYCDNTENIQINCNTFNRDPRLDRSTPSQRYGIVLRRSKGIMISANHFGSGYLEADALESDSSSYTSVNNIGLKESVAPGQFDDGQLKNIEQKPGELVYVSGIRHLAYYNSDKKRWVYLKAKRLKQA